MILSSMFKQLNCRITFQLRYIPDGEFIKSLRLVPKPGSQINGRSNLFQPFVKHGSFFAQSSWP